MAKRKSTARERLTIDQLHAVALVIATGVDWLVVMEWISVSLSIFLDVLPFLLPLLLAGMVAAEIEEYVPRAMKAAQAGEPIPAR